jgi:hypothetical protein
MSRLSPRARKRIKERIDEHADEVDNNILTDEILLVDDGAPEALHHIAQSTSSTHHAMSCLRDPDADETPAHDQMSDAHFAALEALSEFIEQLVAETCAHVIQHADKWADRDANPEKDVLVRNDREEYDDAKREAREWLQEHVDAARRAGVLDEIDAEMEANA